MPMIVANNLNALATQNALNANNSKMSGSLERLSTGYKINSGKDDPSGLVISEQLRAQNVGLERAIQNTQEANNVLGIAEGALNEMNNILSKMRQLAVHSANNGVTSPEQIAADQAEVDSSIQTLDRIARTTKFSDQFLLNGNKELQYDSNVMVTDTFDMKLVNENLSDVRQIFKRDDFKLNISFSGKTQAADGTTDIDNGNEAQKGYFEVSKDQSAATQLMTGNTDKTKNYTLTADQAFTLGGEKGSRYLSFAKGTHLGEMVTSINSVKDSTGVEATLIYDNDAEITNLSSTANTQDIDSATHASGSADVFNRTSLGEITTDGVAAVSLDAGADANFVLGKNVDGYGRAYLKMIDDDTFEIYKDSAMTMKVAEGDVDGTGNTQIMAVNNSDFKDIDFTFSNNISAGMTSTLQLGVFQESSTTTVGKETIDFDDLALASSTAGSSAAGSTHFVEEGSYLSGIKLGENTDETGKVYIKADINRSGAAGTTTSTVYVYKDARMRDEDLVAQSDDVALSSTGASSMRLYAADAGSNGGTSGLYGTLNFDMSTATQDLAFETAISAENLGLRISAEDYGSNSKVTLDQHEGAIFSRYSETDGPVLIDAGLDGATWTEYGRDATVSLNGQELKLDGIEGTITNLDTTATIVFNEGGLGTTTLAAVGYDEGAWGSRARQMYDDDNNYVTHALHGTTETLGDWEGGMQFQLGEGSGDQERTILSIKDMTATQLGKTKFTGSFETDLESEKYLSINDMLSGGWASLAEDPVKSLEIIDQAIEDVSELRANIGAFQANMLETNANSLSVAVENITKTESYIRDADMAKESTEFSKNQILVQAGTSMLAQANQLSQGALSLLG